MKKNKLLICPVFIPHEGCPYRCVFCSQGDITGSRFKADKDNILNALDTYLTPAINSDRFARRELAFYGGSFTGLSEERQEFLLSIVKPFIEEGRIDAIRVSTHPFFIDQKRLTRLKAYGVEIVELGVQSTNQEVLEESGRPCTMKSLLNAVSLITKFKFKLGIQLMLGLPGDNEKRFKTSVANVICIAPDFVRLYPALVLRHTQLYLMYQKGLYVPWSMKRTLNALKGAVKSLVNADIPVIRVGLQPDSSLIDNLIAGPFHPSLRYLVDCQIGFECMVDKIRALSSIPKRIFFKVPKNSISIYTGNRRENLRLLKEQFGLEEVRLRGEESCSQLELVV